jgi:hypothetical protein
MSEREYETIEGMKTPSEDDVSYMDYLDELIGGLPTGHSYGLLLYKADPTAFRLGRDEWLARGG